MPSNNGSDVIIIELKQLYGQKEFFNHVILILPICFFLINVLMTMCSFPYNDFCLNAFVREQRTVPRWSLSWRLRTWERI